MLTYTVDPMFVIETDKTVTNFRVNKSEIYFDVPFDFIKT